MEIYMDNSATTKPYDEVANTVFETMKKYYGNPSSLHKIGKIAEDEVTKARKFIAKMINAKDDEIYFTSGGTESDNIGILGYCLKNQRRGKKIITTTVEHPAVLECYKYLSSIGFDVVYAEVDKDGLIESDSIANLVDENTILVSVMHINNETGAIMPIKDIGQKIKIKNPNCAFFVDAVQSFGKVKIDVCDQNIDMLSASAHKIGGPNGVGFIYIMKKIKIQTPVLGGGQEKTIRSGTHNVAGIMGFFTACKIKQENYENDNIKLGKVKAIIKDCVQNLPYTKINSCDNSSNYILNVSFDKIKSEIILHVLESNGVFVSSGSACSSRKTHISHVLSAMNIERNLALGAIRFSFSPHNSTEDAQYVAEILNREIPILQKTINRR